MSERPVLRGGAGVGPVVKVRAGGAAPAGGSWLKARAPGVSARQRQAWRERLWACLSLLVLVAGWDVCGRLDEQAAAQVLEQARWGA